MKQARKTISAFTMVVLMLIGTLCMPIQAYATGMDYDYHQEEERNQDTIIGEATVSSGQDTTSKTETGNEPMEEQTNNESAEEQDIDSEENNQPEKVSYTVQYLDQNSQVIQAEAKRDADVGSQVAVAESDKIIEGYIFDENNVNNVLLATVLEDGTTTLKLYFNQEIKLQKAGPQRSSGIVYKGKVTIYGTTTEYGKESEAFSGPTYSSKVVIELPPRTGSSYNNVEYRIPAVSEYFTVKPGWEIRDVQCAGNSSGSRQPGGSFLLSMSGGSLVYYFQRVQKNFVLSYNLNGGTPNIPQSSSGYIRETSWTTNVSSTTPSKTGYVFKNWMGSDGKTYNPGSKITLTDNVVLTAQWEEKKPVETTYTVKWYDENGNEIKTAETRTANAGDSVSVTEADKMVKGYTFDATNTKNVLKATAAEDGSTVLKVYLVKNSIWTKPNTSCDGNLRTGDVAIEYTFAVMVLSGITLTVLFCLNGKKNKKTVKGFNI